ncbi:nicotinate phosphoribosyltransferase [Anaeramoeba ignava]|uniref:Nicotinate phosphoribosyltransferase n=1 Tax=Anaeramoeba ignava TaxID=1746090 RepID=A0A9Q0LAF8_ANAIG|nr:nicotinate phosphoribosyltransferase [Anaeramoeba ignava]
MSIKVTNSLVTPLLTDKYQLTMAYAYWKSKKQDQKSVFDLFFRVNPFGGEFTIFAGLSEVMKLLPNFKFTEDEIDYLKKDMVGCEDGFFDYLRSVDASQIKLYALNEGTLSFPKIPLIRVEGPLAISQLLETPLLNLINYPSLLATNSARMKMVSGHKKTLLEFGCRRAQGPDGAISASRYSYIGGFDATSNMAAGKIFGIPTKGTHAHSFVSSYLTFSDIKNPILKDSKGIHEVNFVDFVLQTRKETGFTHTNDSELASFIGYALSFPNGFLALVDTYDTLLSGVPNFLTVAYALHKLGYKPTGIRLDSGDLAYLSKETRRMFTEFGKKFNADYFSKLTIVASNDLNEESIIDLNKNHHEIDVFGIGTHLVTCQAQPALGCVYKLVEIDGIPRIKLSNQLIKVTIPGKKEAYRLYGNSSRSPILDVLVKTDSTQKPKVGERFLCRDPSLESNRMILSPSKVVPLHHCYWDGKQAKEVPQIGSVRKYVIDQIHEMNPSHFALKKPLPYKVTLSDELYHFLHDLWIKEQPPLEIN